MTENKDDHKKSEASIFRVIELIPEVIAWLQIVASPLLIGLVVGTIVYLTDPTGTRLLIGIAIASVGLIVGIIWATRQWKGKGTVSFMSRTIATPELDRPDQDDTTAATERKE